MSKEVTTIYKCDRCGKRMGSPYAILTLKHAGCNLDKDSCINKDLCADCYDKISFLFNNEDANVYDTTSSWVSTSPITVSDTPVEQARHYVDWGNDILNKHLNATCV